VRIITSTADELSGGTNIDDLERASNAKTAGFSEFFAISGCCHCATATARVHPVHLTNVARSARPEAADLWTKPISLSQ